MTLTTYSDEPIYYKNRFLRFKGGTGRSVSPVGVLKVLVRLTRKEFKAREAGRLQLRGLFHKPLFVVGRILSTGSAFRRMLLTAEGVRFSIFVRLEAANAYLYLFRHGNKQTGPVYCRVSKEQQTFVSKNNGQNMEKIC
jgi:hypothetical protein